MIQPRPPIGTGSTEAPKPLKLAHVVFLTANFDAMKRWYATVLGARPAYENPMLTFMTYDDEHHRIGIISHPDVAKADAGPSRLEHVAFTYADLPSLLHTYRRLKNLGIEPFWTINHGPTISFYYKDPDGNKIELQHDVFATNAEVDAFFASGAYDENFIGIIIDPEALISGYEAGVPMEELTRRPRLPEGMTPWDMHRA